MNEINGLGDLIAKILHTGWIGKLVYLITGHTEPCDGCEERRRRFNELVAFKKKQKQNK